MALATNIPTYKDTKLQRYKATKIHTLTPLTYELFFQNSSIKEKHPEHKAKISQLQREIRSLENKAQEEEAHLKGFTAARERAKSSFFYVMRRTLKKQNQVKYFKQKSVGQRSYNFTKSDKKRFPIGRKMKIGDFC